MKRTLFVLLLIVAAACDGDRSPTKPPSTGAIQVVLENRGTAEKSIPDSTSAAADRAAKPARLTRLEVRVLKSDNSVLDSKTIEPTSTMYNVTLTVEALNDLRVLCLGMFDGTVGYFGIDEDVDVEVGKTTTAVITGWTEPYLPQIGSISPNPSADGSYTVSWTEAPNATVYKLQEADNATFSGADVVYSGSGLRQSFTGKASGIFYYRVQASNVYNVTSSWSDTVTATVQMVIEYLLSGTITGAGGEVTVALSGDAMDTRITGEDGIYSFTMTGGGSYTVTPSKTDYTFTPASRTYNNVTADQIADFTGTYTSITYTISGGMTGADGVLVTLSGDLSDTRTVNDGERYSFTVQHGGWYTVTPSKEGYTFTPPSISYDGINSNVTRDFAAYHIEYVLSGTVTGADGVLVTMSGDASDSQAVNDGGAYSYIVYHGGTYTVTPTKDGYTFTPASWTFTNVTANQMQNFTATQGVQTTYTISGTVTGADGVLVTLSGSATGSQTVNSGGSYSFTVAEGGTYTMTPSKAGYTFTPFSQTFSNVTSNQTQNFTASQITYTISGTVSGADGVLVTLSGSATGSQVVNSGGSYSFTVAEGGTYTVTPSELGYIFSPAIQVFRNVTSNQTQNFTAQYVTYTLSGTVSGADGVTITLGGDASGSQVVNDGESYSFIVAYGGTYTVTPRKLGYTFTPPGVSFNDFAPSHTQNFTAQVITHTISGTVSGADGVLVTLSGDASDSQAVNNGGAYSYIVYHGGTYTITPTKDGYLFTPASWTFTNVTANQMQNFTAEAVTPTGGRIAFSSDRDGNYEIYVMDSDGSNQRNLTNNPAGDYWPSWSPDGARIAFMSSRDDSHEIYVMNADGSNQRRLTNNPASDHFTSWSPDSARIAFTSSRDDNWEIYVMDSDGSNQRNLTNNPAGDYWLSWSPDGERIAFTSDRDGNTEIYVMDADGSNQQNLTNNPASDTTPSWSPDGSRIAFHSSRDGRGEIYVMDADGSNQRRLTNTTNGAYGPSWSPDGTCIAYNLYFDGNNWEIYVMDSDGSNQRNLTNNPAVDDWPSWSPF